MNQIPETSEWPVYPRMLQRSFHQIITLWGMTSYIVVYLFCTLDRKFITLGRYLHIHLAGQHILIFLFVLVQQLNIISDIVWQIEISCWFLFSSPHAVASAVTAAAADGDNRLPLVDVPQVPLAKLGARKDGTASDGTKARRPEITILLNKRCLSAWMLCLNEWFWWFPINDSRW
jgi:hypothetical protein